MLKLNSVHIAKNFTTTVACLIALAALWQQASAQVTLEKARDTSLKKSEAPKVQKLPDLVVTSIKYSGNQAAISVHNKGIETSAPCRLHFSLENEQWAVNVPALIPKGFVHTAKIGRAKSFSGKGVAKIDFDNQIAESNEGNNTLTIDQPAVAAPDIAALDLSFKDEFGATQIVGRVKNVSNADLIESKVKVRLIRITKYGAHQNILDLKTENLPDLNAGIIFTIKAPMPKPFPGADSYTWILRVDGDSNAVNNKVEKKSTKVDNN